MIADPTQRNEEYLEDDVRTVSEPKEGGTGGGRDPRIWVHINS